VFVQGSAKKLCIGYLPPWHDTKVSVDAAGDKAAVSKRLMLTFPHHFASLESTVQRPHDNTSCSRQQRKSRFLRRDFEEVCREKGH
jgi:hypothetical protein